MSPTHGLFVAESHLAMSRPAVEAKGNTNTFFLFLLRKRAEAKCEKKPMLAVVLRGDGDSALVITVWVAFAQTDS